jgi:hypothetical protein
MDITKCKGDYCPIRDKCKRYTLKPSISQSYLVTSPFLFNDGGGSCDMFWGEGSDAQLKQIKEILK